jgi:pimeloyl-ACP methyl ester carboxylesterase
MSSIEAWWSAGKHAPINLSGVERAIFLRRMGSGPSMTLLHGFPSSSYDWAKITAALAPHRALLLPDLLGFGASEKPSGHAYSLQEQADLVEALWEREGISSTVLVVHDYSVSIAQELLARRAEGALTVEISAVHLLNGALYPELAQLEPGQVALLDPELGPQFSAAITEELFVAALRPTFAQNYDAAADSTAIWRSTARAGGQRITHLLIRYVIDRAHHRERWITALQSTDVPLSFIWGMLDPVSGAHMAQRIRERLPNAPMLALEDVGHWPALEAPEQVSAALLR